MNSRQDTIRVAGLLAGYLVSAVMPPALDPWMIRNVTRLYLRLRPRHVPQLAARMASTLGEEAKSLAESAEHRYLLTLEGIWGRVRGLHERGWTPNIRVTGLDHLRASQSRGRGTILWRMSFCSTLIVKIALWRAGIPLVHLSKEQHGANSDAWISRHVLCPLYRRAEGWYLHERAVIPWGGNPVGAMRTLFKRLSRDNAVVSIFGDSPWASGAKTSFFDGHARFALGAPQLAAKVGCTLLPVHVEWEGIGTYCVVIGRPIELSHDTDREARLRSAVEEFSMRMESAIRAHPESWAYWGLFWSATEPFSPPSD